MKNNNLWRVIWVIGIYAVLAIILYLVIMYKVKWEDKDFNKYLYFYNCSNSLCTSDTPQNKYYSKIVCEDNACPYISNINDTVLILKKDNTSWLYDYAEEKIVNDKYVDYKYLNGKYYAVKDTNGMLGVIDTDGNIVVNFDNYDEIKDYNSKYFVYKKSGKYSLRNIDSNNDIQQNKDDIVLINDKLYALFEDGIYHFMYIENNSRVNDIGYNYIYSYDDTILAFSNKKVDILNTELKSTLVMPIATFYEYKARQERDSLKIRVNDNILHFVVILEDNKAVSYRYDLINKKVL